MMADQPSEGARNQTLAAARPGPRRAPPPPPLGRRLRDLPPVLEFRGEFGAEMNTFIPYVHWLHRMGLMRNRKVETYAGMEPFYFFLAPDQLILRSNKRHPVKPFPDYFPHRDDFWATRTGMEWTPDYRAHYAGRVASTKPICIVHNKYTTEWRGDPVNFFELDVLDALLDGLKRDFHVFYFEAARAAFVGIGYSADSQSFIPYDDLSVARNHPEVTVFGDAALESGKSYNQFKLELFSNAWHFMTVQGGNAHLCALFPGSLCAVLHRAGREADHGYHAGTFQFLANPKPIYLLARESAEMLPFADVFRESTLLDGRVHLGPKGLETLRRASEMNWPGRGGISGPHRERWQAAKARRIAAQNGA